MTDEANAEDGQAVGTAGYSAFLSYASDDRAFAETICKQLETSGFRCWMAPRDVRPGEDYPTEIIRGIEASKCLILVLSQAANASPFVRAEVERAYSKGKPIFPVRVEDVLPAKALEIFVSTKHWIDAWRGDLSLHVAKLALEIARNPDLDTGLPPELMRRVHLARWLRYGAMGAGAAAIALIVGFVMRDGGTKVVERPAGTPGFQRPITAPSPLPLSYGRPWIECARFGVQPLPTCAFSIDAARKDIARIRLGTSREKLDEFVSVKDGTVSGGIVAYLSPGQQAERGALGMTYLLARASTVVYAQVEFDNGAKSDIVESSLPAPPPHSPRCAPNSGEEQVAPKLLVCMADRSSRRTWSLVPIVGSEVKGISWTTFDGGSTPVERVGGAFAIKATARDLGAGRDGPVAGQPVRLRIFYQFGNEKAAKPFAYAIDLGAHARRFLQAGIDLKTAFDCALDRGVFAASCRFQTSIAELPPPFLFDKIFWGTSPHQLADVDRFDAQAIIDAFEHADPKDVTTRNTASRTRPQYRNWRSGNQFGSKFLGISTVPDAVFFKVRYQDGTESAVVRIPVS